MLLITRYERKHIKTIVIKHIVGQFVQKVNPKNVDTDVNKACQYEHNGYIGILLPGCLHKFRQICQIHFHIFAAAKIVKIT